MAFYLHKIIEKILKIYKSSNNKMEFLRKIATLNLLFFFSVFSISISFAADIWIIWDPNNEPDIAGYKVYFGKKSRVYENSINVGNVTSYNLRNLNLDTIYFFAVTAYDTNGLESDYSEEIGVMIKDIRAGWNLISIPFSIGVVPLTQYFFPSNLIKIEKILTYKAKDTNDPWKVYDPAAPSYVNDLIEINESIGLWIKAKENMNLILYGRFLPGSTLPLVSGWNLIQYPGNTKKSVVDALSSISGKYEKIIYYQSTDLQDPWKVYDPSAPSYVNDLSELIPGGGYWIKVKENCNWTITN